MNNSKCITQMRYRIKLILIISLALVIMLSSLMWVNALDNEDSDNPEFDINAVMGIPTVDEKYSYATVSVEKGYVVRLCGNPQVEKNNVNLYLTNLKDNTIWFKAQIYDENYVLLGESGVLKTGQYVKSIRILSPIKDDSTVVNIRIIAYEPKTYVSRGNVNVQTTLYKDIT